jgi:hypothetical protein
VVFSRLLWLAVPLVGLGELVLHLHFASRPATLEEWRELAPELAKLRRRDELVVIAPRWAEPLARHAFGDELMPLAQVARPDAGGFQRAIEVGMRGAVGEELEGWRLLETRKQGPFELRLLENPKFVPTQSDFVELVAAGRASVSLRREGVEQTCAFVRQARVEAGGLHGHVTYPRARFRCAGQAFVGVTVIDDQDYRPRRCILAKTPEGGSLSIRFEGVPLGRSIRGFAGLSYFIHRDGRGAPVTLRVRAGGTELGSHLHREETGFHPFAFEAAPAARVDLEFEVASASAGRDFCFFADSR